MNEVEAFLRSNGAKQDFAHWSGKFQDMKNLWSALMKGIPEEEDEGKEWNKKAHRWALWILSRKGVLTGKECLNLTLRFSEPYITNKPLFVRYWDENFALAKKILCGEKIREYALDECLHNSYTDYINATSEAAGIAYYVLLSYINSDSVFDAAICCLNAAYEYAMNNESDDSLIAECLKRFNTNAAGNAWDEERVRQFWIIQTMDNPFKQSEGEEK